MNSRSDVPPLLPYPSKLFVEVTTRCNLNCFMCVKQLDNSHVCEGDFTPELFTQLEPALPQLEALILNGIGEPLLNPHLESFIRTARRLMPASGWIGFQSNGLLMTNLRALSLVEAGVDRICLSIDSVTPETFRKVREGGELEGVSQAFYALNAAKAQTGRTDVQLGAEFVVMRSNLEELPAAIRWAAGKGADFAIVTHVLPYDAQHAGEAVYGTCTDEAVALFREWKVEAEQNGVDIQRYFTLAGRYSKTVEDKKLIGLVESLKAEAERRGIFLDLKKLFRMDYDLSDAVTSIFQEAQQIADETGLELRLPDAALKEKRQCGFVEDGGAFVTWTGEISPCYFLWHRYGCYANGWQQQVQAKVFGSIADQGILEIWNSSEFRTFRKDVIAYDYPYCASCSLAPCDYVQSDSFEQDCHIRNVPCGACLWCMGVFQCMK
ncbi:MAG: radical SAM/SPASM domain-containing protein [Geobacter sp.]|nr:radical SAM/SPASM domain-containing protein [Geobacter sp.]